MSRVGSETLRLRSAKLSYRNATCEGNRQEEARWANVIGDILKNRGEYVQALKWIRIDYEVSVKFLPKKHLLATCQSLGEVYLRLQDFKHALIYQNKHLELAKDSNDIVEQQRASTQLGRTYHEIFLGSNNDHYSVRNAKKFFQSAMSLAKTLKENPLYGCTSFLKEYIDAHNNIGMLEIDLDNLEEAEKILTKGLQICDEEEIVKDDDGRTRLHHNLGKVYLELRKWEEARVHIEKDITICNRIGHCQGEAKGYINLGELHYRVQKCDEAICCYEKALKLAMSMEDEDALAAQIRQNIETVKEAKKVSDELKKEEQNLKKLIRSMPKVRGTAKERKCLLQQNACLDRLIEKSSTISAWLKHRCYAREKKRVATELCDKEKLGDSFLVLGESYKKLRNFSEALQWYTRSWEIYESIGNLEGQALAKINIGDVLDSDGNWEDALSAFEEGYRIALQANLPATQLDALENMHYSHMIRFDDVEEARMTQLLIDKLKQSTFKEHETPLNKKNCCSETDTEQDDLEFSWSDMSSSNNKTNSDIGLGQTQTQVEDNEDITIQHAKKPGSKWKAPHSPGSSGKQAQVSPGNMARPTGSQQALVGRKRIRVILSDDEEGEAHEVARNSKGRHHEASREGVATSGESKSMDNDAMRASEFHGVSVVASKSATRSCSPINLEESICSHMSRSSEVGSLGDKNLPTSGTSEAVNNPVFYVNGTKPNVDVSTGLSHELSGLNKHFCRGQCGLMLLNIDEKFVHVNPGSCIVGGKLNVECMKIEAACLYYLQLSAEKKSEGRLPIIQYMRCGGRVLDTFEEVDTLKDHLCGKGWIDVSIGGWVQKRVMKLYIDCCIELSQSPNMNILKKLYNSEVSEDEVILSDCELQDESVTPLLNALEVHKRIVVLDLSHNSLGNVTVDKLQKVLTAGQRFGTFILDLHQNKLGPNSLLEICECPMLFSRLEVLNVSGNRLTDVSGYFLSSILENCKALYSLSVECCSITSKTIQKIADALHRDSVLTDIAIGYNYPVSASSIISLLEKLATQKRFSKLNLSGLKFGKSVVHNLCQLTKTSCLETLMLGDTSFGTEGALQLTQSLDANQELIKLDLSSCELSSQYVVNLNTKIAVFSSLVELNLGGNPIMQEGGNAMVSLLKNPRCRLKVLVLSKCQIGLLGVVRILQSLSENRSLEELNLAQNVDIETYQTPRHDLSSKLPLSKQVDAAEQESLAAKTDCDNLEVADSEDDDCVNSSQRNMFGQESLPVQELSTAIGLAKHLKLLDLSDNRLSTEMIEFLYAAWSSCLRADLAQRHIQENNFHFSVHGYKCCGVKPCCRKG